MGFWELKFRPVVGMNTVGGWGIFRWIEINRLICGEVGGLLRNRGRVTDSS